MNSYPNILPEVSSLKDLLISIRRDLHSYPEIGYQEVKTSEYIVSFLSNLRNIKITPKVAKTGVIALLTGPHPGPTILLRADMDALPIQEKTNLSFSSKNPGVHHACGHDGHVAILLTAAKIISEKYYETLKGSVKFVFQPAEEGGFGAQAMIKDALNPLENPKVDRSFGLHLVSIEQYGKIQLSPGFFSASSNRFFVKVKGVGGHGSAPHMNKDPIFVAVQMAMSFYTITGKDVNPCHKAVVSIGKFHAGTAENIIPNECEFSGSFRVFDEEDKAIIKRRMQDIAAGLSLAYEAEASVNFNEGYPQIYNHPEETKIIKEACSSVVGEENVVAPTFGLYGEDFSYFVKDRPGAFFLLGAAEFGKMVAHHNPEFTFNEDSMLIGVSVWVKLVENLLVFS